MSRFSGPQGKGAMRREREAKRLDAADRAAEYAEAVAATAELLHVPEHEARKIERAGRRHLHQAISLATSTEAMVVTFSGGAS